MITKKQIITALVPLGDFKENGDQLKYNCPLCEANGAPVDKFNLEVNIIKEMYHCWACHDSGGLAKAARKFGLAEYAPLFSKKKDNEDEEIEESKILELPEQSYSVLRNQEATDYLLNERGLTREIIKQRNIKWCFGGRQKNSIVFPSYLPNGALNYFVSHDFITKKYYKCKAPNNICFYESFIDRRVPVIVTEGVYDALVIPNGCPGLGTTLTESTLTLLNNCDVIIAFDSFIEKKVVKKAYGDLKSMGCNVEILEVPVEYEDLNDLALNNKPLLKSLLLPFYTKFTI